MRSTILPTTSISMITVMALRCLDTHTVSAASHSNQCDCVKYAHEGQQHHQQRNVLAALALMKFAVRFHDLHTYANVKPMESAIIAANKTNK